MSNPQQQTSPPPDDHLRQGAPLSEVDRQQAAVWHSILNLPDNGATVAAQKVEAEARKRVATLNPETATEAEMRCALSEWQHARNLWTAMSSFVAGVHRRLEAQEAAAQKPLDKSTGSGTIMRD